MKTRNIRNIALLFIALLIPALVFLRKKPTGSNPEPLKHPFATKVLKDELFRLLEGFEVKTFIDIPCGEVSWIYELKPFIQEYTGVDAEEKVLQKNREKYGSSTVHFQHFDIAKDPLPASDLIFCHDVLNFLPQNEILAALLLFKKSGAKYLLVTTCPKNEKNRKGKTGNYNPIHWQLPPYNFPKPLLIINDPNQENKKLALWRIEDL